MQSQIKCMAIDPCLNTFLMSTWSDKSESILFRHYLAYLPSRSELTVRKFKYFHGIIYTSLLILPESVLKSTNKWWASMLQSGLFQYLYKHIYLINGWFVKTETSLIFSNTFSAYGCEILYVYYMYICIYVYMYICIYVYYMYI